jgi:hypothetical protein
VGGAGGGVVVWVEKIKILKLAYSSIIICTFVAWKKIKVKIRFM